MIHKVLYPASLCISTTLPFHEIATHPRRTHSKVSVRRLISNENNIAGVNVLDKAWLRKYSTDPFPPLAVFLPKAFGAS